MSFKLLCLGDLHLGYESRILNEVCFNRNELHYSDLTPTAAWIKSCEAAIKNNVDAVVLLGDVVHEDKGFFTVLPPLTDGLKLLEDAGIEVIAIAGNHDSEVLPYLVDKLKIIKFLGRNGDWELYKPKKGDVQLLGWSFSKKLETSNPIEKITSEIENAAINSKLPVIGLLHCDLDALNSNYAPVKTINLNQDWVNAWFLAHIHSGAKLINPKSDRPIGYLGSVVGLNSKEQGKHGAWLVSDEGGKIKMELIPLSPIWWITLKVDITGILNAAEVSIKVDDVIEQYCKDLEEYFPLSIGFKIILDGETEFYSQLRDSCSVYKLFMCRNIGCFITELISFASPQLNLEELAEDTGAPSIAAKKLLVLMNKDDGYKEIIKQYEIKVQELVNNGTWKAIKVPMPDEEELRLQLISTGKKIITDLVHQK